jgi:glycerophosphoryl diester phosphodiesterase
LTSGSRALAIAHRGVHGSSRGAHPENSIPAFVRAVELGADAIELDVHLTRDGAVIVHHDPVPRGVSRNRQLQKTPFLELTLEEVKQFELAKGVAIPTLDEVFEAVGSSLTLFVELKGNGTAIPVARWALERATSIALHSFDHEAVAQVRTVSEEIPTGLLVREKPIAPCQELEAHRANTLWPRITAVDTDLVNQLRACGCDVIVWTANTPRQWQRLLQFGVAGVCTDDLEGFIAFRNARPM